MFSLNATIEDDEEYHQLPPYEENKTWEELIPANIKLGKKSHLTILSNEKLDKKFYDILYNLFEEWRLIYEENEQQEKLEEELFEQLKDNPAEKDLEDLIGYSFVANLSSAFKKQYLIKWETWLSNYEKLNQERKHHFGKEKKQVEKIIKILKETSREKENTQSANLSWGDIALYGGITVVIIILFSWLWIKIKS